MQRTCLSGQRACLWGAGYELTELTGKDVGLTPPLFYCFGVSPALLHGFVAKQVILIPSLSTVLLLSKLS